MLSHEDKKDVAKAFGSKVAGKVASATNDAKNRAIHAKAGKYPKLGKSSSMTLKTEGKALKPSKYDANEWSKKNLGRASGAKSKAVKKGMNPEQMKHLEKGDLGGFMRTYMK